MTGNIAPRNSWKQKSKLLWRDATKCGSELVRPAGYADYLHIPSACEDRRAMAIRNSCRELIMPHGETSASPLPIGRGELPATAVDGPGVLM
jgi:hypothetical protein